LKKDKAMKILYIANLWDPRIQDEYSGNDYGAYHAMKNQDNVQLELVGPFNFSPGLMERIFNKIFSFFKKRPVKHSNAFLRKSSRLVQEAIDEFQPDVIFSKYCAPLVYVNTNIPLVYMCDSTVVWARNSAKEFFSTAYKKMEKWERKAIQMSKKVITFSHANANAIANTYGKSVKDIVVFPIPSQLPKNLLPNATEVKKSITNKINLLFVGKRYHLRGVDIAIEVVNELNLQGLQAELHIVGIEGQDSDNVTFKGVYHKEQPGAIEAYIENFKWAHLLIHPSRFHSAGIVISEAAGFGVPTITNNVGGLATTVKDGVTGVVLPANSSATLYAESIQSLMEDSDRYHSMQIAARARFDEELHWDAAGEKLFACVVSATENN
jgi:glycosyltransferase involved in cell wall biosynthesis